MKSNFWNRFHLDVLKSQLDNYTLFQSSQNPTTVLNSVFILKELPNRKFPSFDFRRVWLHQLGLILSIIYIRWLRIFLDFKVLCSLQFLGYLRTLSLKFQKARTKIEVVLSLAETANRADSGQLQFWSEPSEILNVRSPSTPETVALTIPWYQTWWNP